MEILILDDPLDAVTSDIPFNPPSKGYFTSGIPPLRRARGVFAFQNKNGQMNILHLDLSTPFFYDNPTLTGSSNERLLKT
jgi:hypothetical protein